MTACVCPACKKADTGKLYAIKTMSKKRITEKKAVELVWNERKILARASSPFVVRSCVCARARACVGKGLTVSSPGVVAVRAANSLAAALGRRRDDGR